MRVSEEIDMKISNLGIDGAEERISDLKDKSFEINQSDKNKDKNEEK